MRGFAHTARRGQGNNPSDARCLSREVVSLPPRFGCTLSGWGSPGVPPWSSPRGAEQLSLPTSASRALTRTKHERFMGRWHQRAMPAGIPCLGCTVGMGRAREAGLRRLQSLLRKMPELSYGRRALRRAWRGVPLPESPPCRGTPCWEQLRPGWRGPRQPLHACLGSSRGTETLPWAR